MIEKVCRVCKERFLVKIRRENTAKFCSRICYKLYSSTLLKSDSFSIPLNSEKVYWIGFVAADGSVNQKNGCAELSLKLKDREHVEKFKNFLKTDRCIKIVRNKYYQLRVNSSVIVDALRDYNIIPNKSLVFSMKNIPIEFERDFWRGMIDGDGWIYKTQKTLKIGICGTHTICQQFIDFVNRSNIVTKVKVFKEKNTLSRVDLNGKCLVPKVARLLYGGSEIYLNRKYEIAKSIGV